MTTMTKVKKEKKWKYHTSHKFVDPETKKEHCLLSQLYQIGVYTIFDNRSDCQGGCTPNQMVSMERKLRKLESEGKIEKLEFGREITVTERDGFFVEVEIDE